jgi:hypothetical protein
MRVFTPRALVRVSEYVPYQPIWPGYGTHAGGGAAQSSPHPPRQQPLDSQACQLDQRALGSHGAVAEPWGLLSAPPASELLLRPLSERATELAVAVSAEAVKSVLVHGPELWFVLLGLSKK